MIRLGSRGDTIVEVLIAIAIIGMILGGALASANRSLQAERRAQERTEASRVAEQQLELLKLSSQQSDSIYTGVNDFCVDNNLSRYNFSSLPSSDYRNDAHTLQPGGNYPVECQIAYNNNGYFYYAWISRSTDMLDPDNFNIRVRWDGAGGIRQQVSFNYRVHKKANI